VVLLTVIEASRLLPSYTIRVPPSITPAWLKLLSKVLPSNIAAIAVVLKGVVNIVIAFSSSQHGISAVARGRTAGTLWSRPLTGLIGSRR